MRFDNGTPLLGVRHSLSPYISGLSVLPLLTVYLQLCDRPSQVSQVTDGVGSHPLERH